MSESSRHERPPSESRNARARRHKPGLFNLLSAFGLDVFYHRSAGDLLFYRDRQGREVEVLDLVGGFGTLLLGHSHPDLSAAAARFLTSGCPNHVQGSVQGVAEDLSRDLARRAQADYCVVFANSGAEAVEAALKHAMLETGSRKFLALEGGFHGGTLGAVQLTANAAFRDPFALNGLDVVRVRDNEPGHLESCFEQHQDIAGFVFEPVRGEGGVRPLERRFLRRAAELCGERGIPLIADECQTGLGRTGHFLASQALGLQPDYVILSKALGGGLAKIAAVLIERRRYLSEFDLIHTSTFADDGFSCSVARAALGLLDPPLLQACRSKGERLLSGLRGLMKKHPHAIADVRGVGLMVGIELQHSVEEGSVLLRYLSAHEQLGLVTSAYLFHAHRIRIAPTVSDPFTLRVQPSARIGDAQIDRFLAAMQDVCTRMDRLDFLGLTRVLPHRETVLGSFSSPGRMACSKRQNRGEPFSFRPGQLRDTARDAAVRRVGWLFHMITGSDFCHLEPGIQDLPPNERESVLKRFAPLASPVVMDAVMIRSRTGQTVGLYPILLPVTTRWLKERIAARQPEMLRELVLSGVQVAHNLGCSIASLGQFTSIATRNGRTLATDGMAVTSGNSYTVALVVAAIERALNDLGIEPNARQLAVVGAAGNIGRACTEMLAPQCCRTILVGTDRPESRRSLCDMVDTIPRASFSCDPGAVRDANVVVCATNAVDPLLGAKHFGAGTIICDVSVPSSLRPDTASSRSDLAVIQGGIARLPWGEDLGIPGFPLPPGFAHGCLAEGLLLGFEGTSDSSFIGRLTLQNIRAVQHLAERHGFRPVMNGLFDPGTFGMGAGACHRRA